MKSMASGEDPELFDLAAATPKLAAPPLDGIFLKDFVDAVLAPGVRTGGRLLRVAPPAGGRDCARDTTGVPAAGS